MKNIKSFEDFSSLDENHKEHSHYMFFQNLHLIKNSVEKMLSLDAEKVDELLNSHDWASDHLSTSKDDVQEVCDFMCTMLGGHEAPEHDEDDEDDEEGEEIKELHTFENFLNEDNVTFRIGDEFDPFGLAYWKNSPKPHHLEEYKGFHPNIMQVIVTLRITKIDGDELIFNDGEYRINKKDFTKTKI